MITNSIIIYKVENYRQHKYDFPMSCLDAHKKPPSPIGFGGFIDEMVKNRRFWVFVGKVSRRGCSAYL